MRWRPSWCVPKTGRAGRPTLVGAVLVGLAALAFAWAGDRAQMAFQGTVQTHSWLHLIITPVMFLAIAAATWWLAPEARGSGIPQVIAASRRPAQAFAERLVSLRAAIAKTMLTVVALAGGAPVGREGPTVQLSAAIMVQVPPPVPRAA